jgi:nitrate reductase delta subunit
MNNVSVLSSCYRLIAELFLYPEERDGVRIEKELRTVRQCPASIRDSIDRFLREPASSSADEYIKMFELSPLCPLYLGSYLFNEPNSCRGMGLSGRNAYMIELVNIYKHFGYKLNGGELPDFLPLVVDFLWISLEQRERDRIGLRRHFLKRYLLPGVELFSAALKKYKSPYIWLIESLEAALSVDTAFMADQPIWEPPDKNSQEKNRNMKVNRETSKKGAKP